MRKIAKDNNRPLSRLQGILNWRISLKQKSSFVQQMAKEINTDIETAIQFLKNIQEGFDNQFQELKRTDNQ